MKSHYIKETVTFDLYSSKAFNFYFKGLSIGILDIETTGLNPVNSSFILGGLISYGEGTFEQFFAETLSEEKAVLELFLDRLKNIDVIITYNGQNFDIPFMVKRAKILGLQIDFKLPYNLDLYLVLNNHSSLRKFLPNLKQKTVENFMGLWADRLDDISGKESIELYYSYLRNRDMKIRETILLHNNDDVHQLSRLIPVIEKVDFHKAMHCMGFLIQPRYASGEPADWLQLNKISISSKFLSVAGTQGKEPKDYRSFGNSRADFKIDFRKSSDSFEISVPLQSYKGHAFLDVKKNLNSFHELENYAFFENDFLVLKVDDKINYLETNHFIKLFINELGEV